MGSAVAGVDNRHRHSRLQSLRRPWIEQPAVTLDRQGIADVAQAAPDRRLVAGDDGLPELRFQAPVGLKV